MDVLVTEWDTHILHTLSESHHTNAHIHTHVYEQSNAGKQIRHQDKDIMKYIIPILTHAYTRRIRLTLNRYRVWKWEMSGETKWNTCTFTLTRATTMGEIITERSGHYSFYTVNFIRIFSMLPLDKTCIEFTWRKLNTNFGLSPSYKTKKRDRNKNTEIVSAMRPMNQYHLFLMLSLPSSFFYLFTWPQPILLLLLLFFFVSCLIYYGKMSTVISEQCLCVQFQQQPTLTSDLEIFRMLLANILSLPSPCISDSLRWMFSTHFVNCLRLLESKRPFGRFCTLTSVCERKQLLVSV